MEQPSSLRDYLNALLFGGALFFILGSYQLFRRGYFILSAPASAGPLYVPNQVIAGVAVLMIGFSFLIGPLTRYFDRFDTWLQYRKEIGIVGGALAILHGIISAYFVPTKYTLAWLLSGDALFTSLMGIAGAFVLALLGLISLQSLIQKIGGARWWFLQRWGLRLVVLLTILHVVPMKWSSWYGWFVSGSPSTKDLENAWMAPAGLVVSLILGWVVAVRLYESFFLFKSWGFTPREIAIDPVLKASGRVFFTTSFWILLVVLFIVFLRWSF